MSYKLYYEGHGQTSTHDDVLNQETTWDAGSHGTVKKGGKFGSGGSFPNGTIFDGATLVNFLQFADGCVFVNCTFVLDKRQPYSKFGQGCIFDNCTLNGVTIPKDAVLNKCKVGQASVQAQTVDTQAPARPDGGDIVVRNPVTLGTRINNLDGNVTGIPGIHGMSDQKPDTSKTEDYKPAV